jgi:hypothetical protein
MKVAVEITLATPALVNLSALTKELQQHPSETLVELVDPVIDYYTATDRSPELKELIEARLRSLAAHARRERAISPFPRHHRRVARLRRFRYWGQ